MKHHIISTVIRWHYFSFNPIPNKTYNTKTWNHNLERAHLSYSRGSRTWVDWDCTPTVQICVLHTKETAAWLHVQTTSSLRESACEPYCSGSGSLSAPLVSLSPCHQWTHSRNHQQGEGQFILKYSGKKQGQSQVFQKLNCEQHTAMAAFQYEHLFDALVV